MKSSMGMGMSIWCCSTLPPCPALHPSPPADLLPSWLMLMTHGVFQHRLCAAPAATGCPKGLVPKWPVLNLSLLCDLRNRPEPDAPRGGSCLNGLSIICQIQLSNSCQTFVIATVPHPRLGRVEVPLTQDALPTRRGVMTPPALCRRAVTPICLAAAA